MYIKMQEMKMDTQFVYVIITTNLKCCLQLKNYLHLTKSTENKPKDNHVQVEVSFLIKL